MLGAAVAGFAVGRVIGGTHTLYRCATCESFLEATSTVCPGCGGTITGDIAHRRDRLEAEERLEDARHLAAEALADDGHADDLDERRHAGDPTEPVSSRRL